MSHRHALTALAVLATAGALAAPTATAAPAPEAAPTTISAYTGSPEDAAATKAFYEAVRKSVLAKRAAAAKNGQKLAAVTVTYRVNAPTFRTQINRSTQIWNSSVNDVRLAEVSSGADFSYREGNDSRGSYASTDGRGHGYIFIDYRQAQQYNSTRITAHETGHVLGLPDHYSGPCSELMSGGGPGTSCTNATPNAAERRRVDQIW
ncbi:snapalysin [Kribbella sandramycini]|uniref:Extracellular small neutral protease n=1 Tax=Kribbella sandramycini TaxID=60450 RepID=A0A7Y4P2U8_9ACTN|nr:snapalysin [Kribbella sandramycini]MBB6571775.1 snapalysin [Kribbella sandramycini]NOL44418.1 snapalysin [Kribbella sandramycini]